MTKRYNVNQYINAAELNPDLLSTLEKLNFVANLTEDDIFRLEQAIEQHLDNMAADPELYDAKGHLIQG